MKLLRPFLLLFYILTAASSFGQDNYRQAYKDYIKACPSGAQISESTMRFSLDTYNQALMKQYDKARSNELIEKYIKEKLPDDVADAVIPHFRETVSESDLKDMTKLMNKPKGQQFQAHSMEMNDKYQNEALELGKNLAFTYLEDKTPEPTTPLPNITKAYKTLFHQYYQAQNMVEMVENLVKGMQTAAVTEQQTKVMNGLATYLRENMETITLNMSYGLMTEDDLRFGIELAKRPSWQHIQQASKAILEDPMTVGMPIILSYNSWLAMQGVELNM